MNLCSLGTIRDLMERFEFAPKKGFGQNFLINPAIPQRIAESAARDSDTCILEIGPGIGALTAELASRYEKVVAVEIDSALIPVLEYTLSEFDNVTVAHEDFMKLPLADFINENFNGKKVSVCANLPYYITTPIIMHLLEDGNASLFESITVMIQTEVAARFTAKAGSSEYGAITAALDYYGTVRKLFDVSAGNFHPAPKVSSSVVQICPYKTPAYDVSDEKFLFEVISAAFGQRRKTLVNTLSAVSGGRSKTELAELLENLGFRADIRGEKLSVSDFVKLSNALFELNKSSN